MVAILVVALLAGGPPWPEPESELQDLYKAIHQAYLGPGHAIPSREAAQDYLQREWGSLRASAPGETLVVWGIDEAPFVRIHLRPYRDRGGASDSILAAFLRSGEVPVDSAGFRSAWGEVRESIRRGTLPFTRAEFDSLDAFLASRGYPAVHHSAAYTAAHRPAYRVVGRAEADRLLRALCGRRPRVD